MDGGNVYSEGVLKLWSVSTKFAREMWLLNYSRHLSNDIDSIFEPFSTLTDNTVKIYGSRGEGLWYPFDIVDHRDVDIVYVCPKILAVEIASESDINDQEMYVYVVDREGSIPGYCRLTQLHHSSQYHCLHITKELNGINYLLNTCPRRVQEMLEIDEYLHSCVLSASGNSNVAIGALSKRGPSISREYLGLQWQYFGLFPFSFNITAFDHVMVINHPKWPSCASEWRDRIRCYGWPSQQQIQHITNKGIYLAPVGYIQSELKDIEWRYSFNEAELELVRSFNSTQINCYVLLKMLVSEYITPHFDDDVISSYHIKTLMFWAVEQTDPKLWVSRNLVELIFRILNVLLDCVAKLSCPSYFIPDENLFAGKITTFIREDVSQILLEVINEGWEALKRLKHFAKNEDFIQSLYEDNDIVDHGEIEEICLLA